VGSYFHNVKNWISKHERKLSLLALFFGFITDALTLRRIDNLYENAVFVSYFLIIGFSIIAINYVEAGKYTREWVGRMHPFLLLLIQFSFGGIFSGFSIFYFRSGSLLSSWPFIVILLVFIIGNESMRKHYERLVLQVSLLFVALFFFTIFAVPVVLNNMGPVIFILSGVVALVLVTGFVYFLWYLVPERVVGSKRHLVYSILSLFLVINLLYFTNFIPPIPLSLKNSGVYHSIKRTGDKYVAEEEQHSGLSGLQIFEDIHVRKGQPLYVYSAVFAPSNINVTVVHNWKHFNPEINRWVSISRIPYTVIGGTDRGYRGYTNKSNLEEGKWTVNIETDHGQVIGRVTFEVVYNDEPQQLVERVL
jgi:hypothetical protein